MRPRAALHRGPDGAETNLLQSAFRDTVSVHTNQLGVALSASLHEQRRSGQRCGQDMQVGFSASRWAILIRARYH